MGANDDDEDDVQTKQNHSLVPQDWFDIVKIVICRASRSKGQQMLDYSNSIK
jgi:hypothetical protein